MYGMCGICGQDICKSHVAIDGHLMVCFFCHNRVKKCHDIA